MLEAWVQPQLKAWSHIVQILGKISKRHPHLEYAILGMSIQLKWQYLERTVQRVITLMSSVEEDLKETLFPALFGVEEVDADFWKLLGHIVKQDGLGRTAPVHQWRVHTTSPMQRLDNC